MAEGVINTIGIATETVDITTDNSGIANTGLLASGKAILSIKCTTSERIIEPFIANSRWYVRIIKSYDGQVATSMSTTLTIVYYNL